MGTKWPGSSTAEKQLGVSAMNWSQQYDAVPKKAELLQGAGCITQQMTSLLFLAWGMTDTNGGSHSPAANLRKGFRRVRRFV